MYTLLTNSVDWGHDDQIIAECMATKPDAHLRTEDRCLTTKKDLNGSETKRQTGRQTGWLVDHRTVSVSESSNTVAMIATS